MEVVIIVVVYNFRKYIAVLKNEKIQIKIQKVMFIFSSKLNIIKNLKKNNIKGGSPIRKFVAKIKFVFFIILL